MRIHFCALPSSQKNLDGRKSFSLDFVFLGLRFTSTSTSTSGTLNRTSGTTTTVCVAPPARQLVCPTSPPGQPLRRQAVIPEHLLCPYAAGPVPTVLSQHHYPQYHHPQSLAAPIAAHGHTPSTVSSFRSVGGVIVPRPEDSPAPSLARISLTPAQAYQGLPSSLAK